RVLERARGSSAPQRGPRPSDGRVCGGQLAGETAGGGSGAPAALASARATSPWKRLCTCTVSAPSVVLPHRPDSGPRRVPRARRASTPLGLVPVHQPADITTIERSVTTTMRRLTANQI